MCVYIYIIFYKLEFWKVIGTHHGNTALSLGGCCLERPVIYLYDMRVHMPCTVYVYSSISNKCNICTWQSHMPTMTSDCLSLSQTVCQEGYPQTTTLCILAMSTFYTMHGWNFCLGRKLPKCQSNRWPLWRPIYTIFIWLVVSTPLKNISQLGWLF